jgi:serine/threonine protein kinase
MVEDKVNISSTSTGTIYGPGDIVADRFEITSVIGSGGFGVVYKARQLNLDRDIALKVMHSWVIADSESVVRFEREGKILTSLQHKNIVVVHSFGIDQKQRCYMSMQYLQGRSLGDLLLNEGKMIWQRAVRIAIQICDALAVAHEHGVVHRDLKPHNVMLVEGPEADFVKILDFGLCGALPDTMTDFQKLTQTGEVLGSVHYMAPEVCQGMRADRRSDIYSVGCILYECLSGRPPLDADDAIAVMFLQTGTMPPRLKEAGKHSDLPDELELAVFKSMQKDPRERFQTMEEFQEVLRAIVRGESASISVRDVVLPSSTKTPRGNAMRYALISLCALAAMVIVAALLFTSGTPNEAIDRRYDVTFEQGNSEIERALSTPDKEAILMFSHAARLLEQALREAPPDWPRSNDAKGLLTTCYIRAEMTGELFRLTDTWHPLSHQWDVYLSNAYLYLGTKSLDAHDYRAAESYGNALTILSPASARDVDTTRIRGLAMLGESCLHTNRVPAAADYFDRALHVMGDASPNSLLAGAKLELARIYLGVYGNAVPGNKPRALSLLKEIMSPPFMPEQRGMVRDAAKLMEKYEDKDK